MLELVKRFIGEECILNTFNGLQIIGTLKEISGNALLVEKDGCREIINLDFVVRIRPYPRKANGRRKAFLID